jgi:hypothetical protein
MDPQQQVQGLPSGSVVTPLPEASQVQGLPPGSTIAPVGSAATPAPPVDPRNPYPNSGWKSLLNENIHIDPSDSAPLKFVKGATSFGAGIGDELLNAAGGIVDLTNKVGNAVTPTRLTNLIPGNEKQPIIPKAVSTWLQKNKSQIESDNAENPGLNKAGNVTGVISEFLSGEEILKGLSKAAQLEKIAPVMETLKNFPRVSRAIVTALRQGAVGTAQALVHHSDAWSAIEQGGLTGAVGGVADLAVPAVYAGAKNLITRIRPTTRTIENVVMPALASQAPDAAAAAGRAATITDAPAVAAAQQEGGQQAVVNIAQRATKNGLDRVNATRATAPITDPARLLAPPEGMQPFQFHIEGPPTIEGATSPEGGPVHYAGTREVPNPAYKPVTDPDVAAEREQLGTTADAIPDQAFTGQPTTRASNWQYTPPPSGTPGTNAIGGGRLVTTDPATAQSALSRLEDLTSSRTFESLPAEQQQAIIAQRDSLQQQLGMFHAGDGVYPHFEPVDTNAAVGHVTNFGEASDQLQAAVKPVYQKLDAVSGGNFTALRNQMKAASKVMFQPGSMDAYEKALQSHEEAEQGIQELFNRHSGDISRVELQSANSAWRDSVVLDKLHATVEGAFKGAPKDIADKIGTNRILRGDNLTSRLNTLLKKTPPADIERVIGQDGLHNLYRVGELLSKPATAVATQNVAKETARELFRRVSRGALVGGLVGHIVGHAELGAVAGASAEDATRWVLRQAAINPRIGTLVDRAVRHQVSPKIFAPLISAALTNDPQEEPQQ